MSNTTYWLKSPATKIWLLFISMACTTTWALTLYIHKPIPEVKALDYEIAKMVIKSGSDFCHKIKAKNYMARYDMGTAASGCVK